MTNQAKPISRPWRRSPRFSVRDLIVLALLLGGGTGWWLHGMRVQRDAVATIRKANGWVGYDWEWNAGRSVPIKKPWAPRWLIDRIGLDCFSSVSAVNL